MPWSAPADPDRFDEAVEWFEGRIPFLKELLDELDPAIRQRAFTVANVAQLTVVQQVLDILTRIVANRGSLDDFKREAKDLLTKAWGGKNPHRVETIFRTNTQTAYNRGRWRQMQKPAVRRLRPFLMYDAVLDSRTSDLCKGLDGTVLSALDEFWLTHHPPLHHRCRSALRTLTPKQAERRGLTTDTSNLPQPAEGFGDLPVADEWEPDPTDFDPELWAIFKDKT